MNNLNLSYTEKNGLNYPNIQISNNPEDDQPLGLYGRMALKYLSDNKPILAMTWHMQGILRSKMHQIDNEVPEMIETLTQQMLEKDPVPKTEDILERTRHLNAIHSAAEEIALKELIYN